MKGRKLIICATLLFLGSFWGWKSTSAKSVGTVDNLEMGNIKSFHKLEIKIKVPAELQNPYDPEEV
ncbi:MAG: hypothetical protein GXY86_05505, partial [Firmicutes bacterium]|nr:hypothetical protein [Bacillota bacterium]